MFHMIPQISQIVFFELLFFGSIPDPLHKPKGLSGTSLAASSALFRKYFLTSSARGNRGNMTIVILQGETYHLPSRKLT